MTILADPLSLAAFPQRRQAAAKYYGKLHQLVLAGQGCTEAVIIADKDHEGRPGSRYLFDSAGYPTEQLASIPADDNITTHLVPLSRRPAPAVHQGIAFLPILPRVTLLIVGGGHVGQAVARLATEVDFDVWVMDDRAAFVSDLRFPTAQRRLVGEIGPTLQQLVDGDVNPSVYALVVTRGHNHDEEALYHLAHSSAGYVGMIGSKRKIKLIYEDLIGRGISAQALAKVHAPLGFAIGSQTVPEIAVSIVAELIACRNLGATLPGARIRVAV
jgi:xanthine dehydrogenase accessory factor